MTLSQNKKKIIFVITRSQWGGAQRYVYDLATHLPREKFEVQAAMGRGGALADKLTNAGVPVYLFDATRNIGFLQEIKTFVALFQLFRKERPDIVHLNSSKIGGVGAVAARIARVPRIIFTAHGWAFHEDRSWFERSLILASSWLSSLFHDSIICVSDYDHAASKKLPFAERKCVTIKNALHNPQCIEKTKARHIIKKENKLSPSQRTLWVGAISELIPNKGLIHLIRALGRIPSKNWFCVIFGEGKERERLQRAIYRFGLAKNMALAGYRENAQSLLKAFDIFVLPSTKEGFPYALLEAGSAGLPVIASEVGGIPEIIHGGKTGLLIPPKNEKDLTNALSLLLTKPELRAHFGNALCEKIEKEFGFDAMLAQTINLYEKNI